MAPRCAPPSATDKNQPHLQRRSFVSPAGLFFQLRPAFFAPALDRGLIALGGSLDWLLHPVLACAQGATAMGGMIARTKVALDHVRYPLRRPHLSSVPSLFCSLGQDLRQRRQLLRTSFRLWPWCWVAAQPLDPLSFRSAHPLTHSSFAHCQGRCHLFLLPSLLGPFLGTQTTPFFPIVCFVVLLHPSRVSG